MNEEEGTKIIKKYECPLCGWEFFSKEEIRRHIKVSHTWFYELHMKEELKKNRFIEDNFLLEVLKELKNKGEFINPADALTPYWVKEWWAENRKARVILKGIAWKLMEDMIPSPLTENSLPYEEKQKYPCFYCPKLPFCVYRFKKSLQQKTVMGAKGFECKHHNY